MVDNTIALRLQSPQIESPINRMAKFMQLQAFKAQSDTAQQGLAKNAMLNKAYADATDASGNVDIGKLTAALATGGAGAYIPEAQTAYATSAGADTKSKQAALDLVKNNADYAIQHIGMAKTADEARTIIGDMAKDKRIDPSTAQMFLSRIPADPAGMPAFTRDIIYHALSAEKQLEQHFNAVDTGGSKMLTATPAYGGGPSSVVYNLPTTASPDARLTAATSAMRLSEGKPDAWGETVDPKDPNKRIQVPMKMINGVLTPVPVAPGVTPLLPSEANVTGQQNAGLTPAQAQAREMPTVKEQAKLDANYGTAKSGVNSAVNNIDTSIALIDEIVKSDSLNAVTGKVNRMLLPTTRSASVALESKFNTLKNKGWVQSLINLRTAGGRIGGASDQEGRRIEEGLGAFSLDMKPAELVPALQKYRSDLEFAKQNLLNAFDETYAYKNAGAPLADPFGIR